jgi:hypothetical protein
LFVLSLTSLASMALHELRFIPVLRVDLVCELVASWYLT